VWALRIVLFILLTASTTKAASALPALLPPRFFLPVLPLPGFAPTSEASWTARIASWRSLSDMCEYQTSRVRIAANSAIPNR
jgi:hypothetical protein